MLLMKLYVTSSQTSGKQEEDAALRGKDLEFVELQVYADYN